LHGKHISVTETGSGQFRIANITTTGPQGMGVGRAAGGLIGGSGTRDTVPAMLTPGEAVVPRHLVGAIAPFLGAHGVPGFQQGGYVGGIGGLGPWTTGWSNLFQRSMTSAMEAAMTSALQSAQQAAFGVPGTITGTVASWIRAAMALAGAPASWYPALARLVSLESGGNPLAVNPTAVLSEHASGAWQMLPSTFFAYGGRGSLFNPIGEGLAALNYIRQVYGTPYAIPGLFSGTYGGYDAGGWLPPGLSVAWNGTGTPERILGPEEAGAVNNYYVNVQVGHGTHPAAAAREIADILNTGARAGVRLRRSLIGANG
jgi:hypothetical protein